MPGPGDSTGASLIQATIKRNFEPEVLRGDVRSVAAKQWEDVDIFHAGFPCQSFAVAGQARGVQDEQGQLPFLILEVVEVKRFPVIILENVKGLSTIHRELLDHICRALKKLEYEVHVKVLNARFSKLPQNRERLFVVAVRCDYVRKDQGKFVWPKDLPEVNVADFLDPADSKGGDVSRKLPPHSQTTSRAHVKEAYKKVKAQGLQPSQTPMSINAGGSSMHMMYNCCPCVTRARAGSGGFWVSTRGRYTSVQELQRFMGIGVAVPKGWVETTIHKPSDVSDRQWRQLVGNAIPINLLQRVLVAVTQYARLGMPRLEDKLADWSGRRAGRAHVSRM